MMKTKGFTLIELLIVVAIIGIIAAIAIPNLLISMQKGRQKATMGDLTSIGTAIESYMVDWSFAPQAPAGPISALAEAWVQPFYIKLMPLTDGWGTQFQYDVIVMNRGGDLYTVLSYGRDKLPTVIPANRLYNMTSLADFNNDIYFSNGIFSVCPRNKK